MSTGWQWLADAVVGSGLLIPGCWCFPLVNAGDLHLNQLTIKAGILRDARADRAGGDIANNYVFDPHVLFILIRIIIIIKSNHRGISQT